MHRPIHLKILFCLSILFGVFGGAISIQAALTAPATLSITALKATSFTLTWTAATGATGGIAGYNISRDGSLLGSTTTTRTFAVTGLAPSTSYSMTVTARDGAGNASPASAALIVTTPADTTVPSRPADLAAGNITTASFTLTWTGSTDNVGVIGYNIYRGTVLLGSSPIASFNVTGLTPDTSNSITVRVADAAGNLSSASVALVVQTLADPPAIPTGLAATNLKATSFTLTWAVSTGGTGGIIGYDVYQNGTLIGSTTTARTFAISGITPITTYSVTVTARDGAGNVSPASIALALATPADTTVPTRPADLAAANITTTSFTLTWMVSTDNVGVTGYNIYRSGVLLGSTTATTFAVTGMVPDSTNNITVRAVDAAGNISAASVVLAVRMLAVPPSIPTGLTTANLRPASFTLRWIASTGGTGGIVGYNVYLNGTLVGSPSTLSLIISGLTPMTSYAMTVASRDSLGSISGQSAPLTVTTLADITKPIVPTGLSAADVTFNSFTLTWNASTDNVGVISYEVYRNNVLIGSPSAPSYAVGSLVPSTLSSMRVKARDAAGNISGYSAILAVTTSAPPNVPPVVTLTAPVAGSTFTLPFTLTLSATATDNDGTITKVEFFDDATKLGETTAPVSDQPDRWLLTFSSQLSDGIHSVSARATDNRNATTDSAPVVITVKNPNQAPTITLAASVGTVTAPGFLTLTADATDNDGTITKVEFFEGGNSLGELLAPTTTPSTFAIPLALYSAGTYTLTAVATDNSIVQSTSAAVIVTVQSGAAALPYVANFETTEGYRPGPLVGQLSWQGTDGVAVVPATAPGSQQELAIPAAQPVEIFSHDFSSTGVSPVFVDFSARPVAGTDPATAVMFSTPAAQVALVGNTSPAQLWIFGGGVGWYSTGQTIPLDATGRTAAWLRLTTREDYVTKKWDAYLNGQMIAADVAFADATATALTDFSVNGHATAASAFDSFYAGAENPLFPDVNRNGLDDPWETAHGLSLATDNRQLSPTGNGVSVLAAYIAGTDPNDFYNGSTPTLTIVSGNYQTAVVGAFNAQPFVISVMNSASTAPLANAPVIFTIESGGGQLALANTGTPDLASVFSLTTDANGNAQVFYQHAPAPATPSIITAKAGTMQVIFQTASAALSPPPPPPPADGEGNGLPDTWETNNFGYTGVDPNGDADGDGFTNLQEFLKGTNPKDMFDGYDLVIKPLLTPDGQLLPAGLFRVWVGRSDGVPLKNAQFQITVVDNDNILTDGSSLFRTINLTTDSKGEAKINLTPAPPADGGGGGGSS